MMNIQKATEIQSFLTKFPGHLKTGNKKLAFKFDVTIDDIRSIKEKLGFTGNSNKAYEKFRVKKLDNNGVQLVEEVKYEMPNILIFDIETSPCIRNSPKITIIKYTVSYILHI